MPKTRCPYCVEDGQFKHMIGQGRGLVHLRPLRSSRDAWQSALPVHLRPLRPARATNCTDDE